MTMNSMRVWCRLSVAFFVMCTGCASLRREVAGIRTYAAFDELRILRTNEPVLLKPDARVILDTLLADGLRGQAMPLNIVLQPGYEWRNLAKQVTVTDPTHRLYLIGASQPERFVASSQAYLFPFNEWLTIRRADPEWTRDSSGGWTLPERLPSNVRPRDFLVVGVEALRTGSRVFVPTVPDTGVDWQAYAVGRQIARPVDAEIVPGAILRFRWSDTLAFDEVRVLGHWYPFPRPGGGEWRLRQLSQHSEPLAPGVGVRAVGTPKEAEPPYLVRQSIGIRSLRATLTQPGAGLGDMEARFLADLDSRRARAAEAYLVCVAPSGGRCWPMGKRDTLTVVASDPRDAGRPHFVRYPFTIQRDIRLVSVVGGTIGIFLALFLTSG